MGKHGLRAFGLSVLAVLGLMAFMAVGAQASEKAWLVLGTDITANQTVEGTTHVEGVLTVEKETNLEILCGTITTEDLLLIKSTTEATGKVKFTACKTWQGGKDVSKNCKPLEPIVASGKALLILHEAKTYVLFEPNTGLPFAVIEFHEPCALPLENNVKGSLVAECLKDEGLTAQDCLVEEKTHLLKPNEALFTSDKLTYGTKAATLKGIVLVKLASGEPWCGHF